MPTNQDLEPLGIFNVADSYYAAAESLAGLKLPTSHGSFPVQFLYHQTIELYLKALLRQLGYSEKETWGHALKPLADKAVERGISFHPFDLETFQMMDTHDVWETSKYLEVGLKENYPDLGRFQLACVNVRAIAERQLKLGGHALRPTPLSYAVPKT